MTASPPPRPARLCCRAAETTPHEQAYSSLPPCSNCSPGWAATAVAAAGRAAEGGQSQQRHNQQLGSGGQAQREYLQLGSGHVVQNDIYFEHFAGG